MVAFFSDRYTPYYYYEETPYQTQKEEVSGISSIFSFVFGDGDVNKVAKEQIRWIMIGETIR